MAIWSLTQERVEKLMRQIGDKEEETDALIKLSPKDLWNIDLDAFVEEWNLQLLEESERAKKIQRMGRRASHKLGIGAAKGGKTKKKRKMDDSDSEDDSGSDFGPVKKKAKPKKEGLLSYLREADPPAKQTTPTASVRSSSAAPQKQGNLLSHLVRNDVKKVAPPQTDGPSSPAEPEPAPAPKPAPTAKARGPAGAKKPTAFISDDDEDESDVFAAVAKEEPKKPAPAPKANGRASRAATTKPKSKYTMDSDSDDDDDLGDVSTMVKTIGGSTNGVPMFKSSSTVRPGSSSGMPKVAKKASPSVIDIDEDETNYEALMPVASPKKPAPRNVNDTMLTSDSEDDFSLVKSKPAASKLTKVVASKTRPIPKAKVPAAVVAKRSTVLSPAAKAYAARLEKTSGAAKAKAAPAKKPAVIDSDSDEAMDDADALANDILSDEEEEPMPKPKASRALAARPGRRAAAKPAKYVVSDDDEEEDASEASFDDESD